jgi:hypothetical protein
MTMHVVLTAVQKGRLRDAVLKTRRRVLEQKVQRRTDDQDDEQAERAKSAL